MLNKGHKKAKYKKKYFRIHRSNILNFVLRNTFPNMATRLSCRCGDVPELLSLWMFSSLGPEESLRWKALTLELVNMCYLALITEGKVPHLIHLKTRIHTKKYNIIRLFDIYSHHQDVNSESLWSSNRL